MFQYIIRRLLLFIPTLFFITVISFGISRLAPGDPAELKAGVGGEGEGEVVCQNGPGERLDFQFEAMPDHRFPLHVAQLPQRVPELDASERLQ